jgi:hypothetical protein
MKRRRNEMKLREGRGINLDESQINRAWALLYSYHAVLIMPRRKRREILTVV